MAGRGSLAAVRTAEAAIQSIGMGYDLATDLRLKSCKRRNAPDACLIVIDEDLALARDVLIPSGGGISVRNVSKSIKIDKGERTRLKTDVFSFQQMAEQFNQDMSLSGKIPSGHFNSSFDFSGSWQKDASNTKTLAFDGVFIILYNVALQKSQLLLHNFVKEAVPSSWDPAALARFIERFGTHIVAGIKMGGKDVVYVKQPHASSLSPADVQEQLKKFADELFTDAAGLSAAKADKSSKKNQLGYMEQGSVFRDTNPSGSYNCLEGKDFIYNCKRKGGSKKTHTTHTEWSHSVHLQPDVISMSFIPITSLLSGVTGSGFLTHAINLYLRYKPQIQELQQFLEFQLPRQWAPVFGDLALGPHRKPKTNSALQFRFLGPKLYVNTSLVDVGNRPVTGVRLFLEGKISNCLAIHLQHLSDLPKTFELKGKPNTGSLLENSEERKYYEKLLWKSFSHICTAPVQSDDELDIVTGAHFEVGDSGLKKVLFLRLHFSKVSGVMLTSTDWEGSPNLRLTQRSGLMSSIISTRFTTTEQPPPQPSDVNMNSAIYPGGPPVPTQSPKLLKFVDTAEVTRGPQHLPGYWVVSGARLLVGKGKISLKVKYSLLTQVGQDDEQTE
ncbi:unnamed protein product [Rhodiola kirilowii]